ncbi:serine/threonine protein phosphatase [Rhodopirellula islandica]|uniref:Serine/threonine protein phosphatase n=1 Tax=Rhodopirellula islandica TaxID=595434 RepID=A0A0J1EEN0_RHOIS|nr:metallophosphoesterase family protein [Rhodopirellula islandica]KLU03944.1 serine/threonine protein phosphatase [Rhodopirellula islandica]
MEQTNESSGRLIAIGDIHGCNAALQAVLAAINPQPNDILVTLGDVVDRGPDSKGAVDTLLQCGQQTQLVALQGNHEEMMLNVLRGSESHHSWLRYGGVETLDSYGFDGGLDFLPEAHRAFFESLGDYFVYEDYFFTHAAYDPALPLEEQTVEMLRWHSLRQGVPEPHHSGKTAFVGHTANHEGQILDVGHLVCLDTHCYGGGCLTAMDVRTRQTWQANQDGVLLS